MKILCVFGRYAYGDPLRGDGYEYTNFLPAFAALGHEIELFDSFDRRGYPDFADLNQRLLGRVIAFKPDVIFCVLMNYEVWSERSTSFARTLRPLSSIGEPTTRGNTIRFHGS